MSAAQDRRVAGSFPSRARWVAYGLLLQAAGAGGVAGFVWLRVRHQGIGGHLSAATVRLAWHSEVHTKAGLAVLAAGAVIYAAGSVVMARPYLSRPLALFVAVPVAAVAGMLVLGVLAVIVALLIAAVANDADLPGLDFFSGRERRRAKRRRQR